MPEGAIVVVARAVTGAGTLGSPRDRISQDLHLTADVPILAILVPIHMDQNRSM
jgi:hypothetical protein